VLTFLLLIFTKKKWWKITTLPWIIQPTVPSSSSDLTWSSHNL
jgi:hypothetical protein